MLISDDIAEKINLLFGKFFGLYPSTYFVYRNQKELDSSKQQWFLAFVSAGIIDQEGQLDMELLRQGINALPFLNQQFMPSCGQFINLCLAGKK